jgi:hypothetical protein
MKRITGSLIAGCLTLLAFAIPLVAGTVTITSGPTLTPETSFTNNTFTVTVLHNPPGVTGDVLQGSGGATVINNIMVDNGLRLQTGGGTASGQPGNRSNSGNFINNLQCRWPG